MFSIIAQVFYVLIAAAMIALILMQRGAGADAGSGFGGGASATVFGARGSSNFLSRSTAVLAALFFLLSLGMGMFHSRPMVVATSDDLGVMAGVAPKATTDDVPAAPAAAPASSDVPTAAPATATEQPAPEPAKSETAQPEKAGKDGV